MSLLIDNIILELDRQLGDQLFVTIGLLLNLGIFGSTSAARAAIQHGLLPYVRVGPKRIVIPKSAVLAYIKQNTRAGGECA